MYGGRGFHHGNRRSDDEMRACLEIQAEEDFILPQSRRRLRVEVDQVDHSLVPFENERESTLRIENPRRWIYVA